MSVSINKDTKIYASFSENAGNRGCKFFNAAFERQGINALYRSFSVSDIEDAFHAALVLGFSGWAISMPFKREALQLVNVAEDISLRCNSINTVINDDGELVGYNTDYYGALEIIKQNKGDHQILFILGNGGLSGAVQVAARDAGMEPQLIIRQNWDVLETLRGQLIYNCTPLKLTPHESNRYIDCLVGTPDGDILAELQARKQFKLYTGIDYAVS